MKRPLLWLVLIFAVPAGAHLWASTHRHHVLTPERRLQIIRAYMGNVDAGSATFDGTAAVRQEDFSEGITRHPCPPLTWAELLALMDRDARP